MPVIIGTSGWQYRHWRETFYPAKLPRIRWLEWYVGRFDTVESNAAFYRLPRAETFASWRERTPVRFVMAVKVTRYVTHIKRLAEPGESIRRFCDNARHLGPKLGPVLLQLPPSLRADTGRLSEALDAFPPGWRVSVEFRHETWFTEEVRQLLTDRGVASCLTDRGEKDTSPVWRTADWTYLRFHEGVADPRPCYRPERLERWADQLAELWGADADAYVYFNNDPRACALRDAYRFADACARRGLPPTRVPEPDDVRVA
jgi:uncharacterized protein YecE (DUF72 family)